jgi:hypothetical protein
MTSPSRNERQEHPLLIIPNNEGCLLVIGDKEAQINMTPREMYAKAMEFLKRAHEASR